MTTAASAATITTSVVDPESSRPIALDPLNLSSAIKSDAEIHEITATYRAPRGHVLGRSSTSSSSDGSTSPKHKKVDIKGIQAFYAAQNASIERMLKPVDDHRREAKDERVDTNLRFVSAPR